MSSLRDAFGEQLSKVEICTPEKIAKMAKKESYFGTPWDGQKVLMAMICTPEFPAPKLGVRCELELITEKDLDKIEATHRLVPKNQHPNSPFIWSNEVADEYEKRVVKAHLC